MSDQNNQMPGDSNDPLHKKPLSKKWLTQQEVMKLLGISLTTLKTYRREGLIVCPKMRGRLRFNEDDVQDSQERGRR